MRSSLIKQRYCRGSQYIRLTVGPKESWQRSKGGFLKNEISLLDQLSIVFIFFVFVFIIIFFYSWNIRSISDLKIFHNVARGVWGCPPPNQLKNEFVFQQCNWNWFWSIVHGLLTLNTWPCRHLFATASIWPWTTIRCFFKS